MDCNTLKEEKFLAEQPGALTFVSYSNEAYIGAANTRIKTWKSNIAPHVTRDGCVYF